MRYSSPRAPKPDGVSHAAAHARPRRPDHGPVAMRAKRIVPDSGISTGS